MSTAPRRRRTAEGGGPAERNARLLLGAYNGDLDEVKEALTGGADIDAVHQQTGLAALHIAVGTDNLALARYLVDAGAKIAPDRAGRWPSVIAAECRTSEEMCDYIVDIEASANLA